MNVWFNVYKFPRIAFSPQPHVLSCVGEILRILQGVIWHLSNDLWLYILTIMSMISSSHNTDIHKYPGFRLIHTSEDPEDPTGGFRLKKTGNLETGLCVC